MIREEIILKPGRAGTMKQIIAGLDHMALPNGKITCIFELNKQDLLFAALDARPAALPRQQAEGIAPLQVDGKKECSGFPGPGRSV